MPKLRVHAFSVSVDGYGAGRDQSVDHPLGVGGGALHEWAFATRTFQAMHGGAGGATGTDDDFAARGVANVGAWIMGRHMFGPVRRAARQVGAHRWTRRHLRRAKVPANRATPPARSSSSARVNRERF